MIRKALAVVMLAAALQASSIPTLPAPTKQPAPRTLPHKALVQKGTQLNDLGDYSAAIRRFEQVLEENPDDVGAIYELSYTLMLAKEYRKSLETATRGLAYDSKLLPDFYSILGADLDELGDQGAAMAVYEKGMRAFPGSAVLPFNYAITCEKVQKPEEARRLYKAALRADPNHASSHYRLAGLFSQKGYQIPGILAYLRFLELAQDTRRSQQALQFVVGQLLGGAQPGKESNQINVTITLAEGKSDEGDFTGPSTMLGLGAALRFTDEGKKASRPELVVHQHELLFESFGINKQLRKEKKKFAAAYYAPYFRELHAAHHTVAFTYSILRQSGWPEVSEWSSQNAGKINAYQEWARAYRWDAAKSARRNPD